MKSHRTTEAEDEGYSGISRLSRRTTDWWLSTAKVISEKGTRPRWEDIATEHGILDYVRGEDGKVNKASYEAGLSELLYERDDIEYDAPELGQTQALGIQQNLLVSLPEFYLLQPSPTILTK